MQSVQLGNCYMLKSPLGSSTNVSARKKKKHTHRYWWIRRMLLLSVCPCFVCIDDDTNKYAPICPPKASIQNVQSRHVQKPVSTRPTRKLRFWCYIFEGFWPTRWALHMQQDEWRHFIGQKWGSRAGQMCQLSTFLSWSCLLCSSYGSKTN